MLLFAGLGNPGSDYAGNRHNVGFMAIDALAEVHSFPPPKQKFQGWLQEGRLGNDKLLLLKPATFMNKSGKAVRHWALKENIAVENILILADELHLPFGTLRLRAKGSPAGHNGLKDVEAALNTPHYARLRFGIGPKNKPFDQVRFVLDPWTSSEATQLPERLDRCAEAIESFGLQGLQKTMNLFNGS